MKYHILFVICLFFINTNAQTVTVSDDINLRNDVRYELLGKLKDRFLLFKGREFDFEVIAFDERLRKTWDKDLDLDKKRPEVIGIVPSENEFAVVYHFRQKNHILLKAHKYDAGANLTDSLTLLDYGSSLYTPPFEMIYSEDRSKVMVFKIERNSNLHVTTFSLNPLQFMWEKDFSPDGLNWNRDFQQLLLDNTGDMHLVLSKNNQRFKQDKHHYEIHHFSAAADALNFYRIPLQNTLTYDVNFDYDNLNKNLVAGGFYSDRNTGRADGYFYLNIPQSDPAGHLLMFEEFEAKFMADITGTKEGKLKGLAEIEIPEIVLRRDGGILLIGERNKNSERRIASASRYYDATTAPYIIDYYYDDVFVISIHPDGREHWKNVLHKKQYSQDDDAIYSSYFLLKTPSALRMLYNDEIRYENTVSEYVIKGDGSFDRNSVLSTENQNIRLRFRDALQTGANELLVPSERRSRLKLVRVEY